MVLIRCNKRFLHLTKGAPGITHDAHLMRHKSLFKNRANGEGIPNKSISLGDSGLIPLVAVSGSSFPRLQ